MDAGLILILAAVFVMVFRPAKGDTQVSTLVGYGIAGLLALAVLAGLWYGAMFLIAKSLNVIAGLR